MSASSFDSSASGYLADSFEGIGRTFTDVEVLHTSATHVVARAKRYGRWWLLKGLREEVRGQSVCRQMLRKELETLMLLQHPAVCTAVGLEEVEGMGECIVMEYVEGSNLRDWLSSTTTLKERRTKAEAIVEAVAYIHAKGIVHRDLKPANIMVTAGGVKLIDFGLSDADMYAVLKQPAGTLKYMSPEQAAIAEPDPRNDLYSLGLIFQEMRLGRAYRPLIRRLLLPLDQRTPDAKSLLEQMRRASRSRNRWLTLFGVMALAVLLTALSFYFRRLTDNSRQSAQTADSLRREFALSAARYDSIGNMQAARADSLEASLARSKENERALLESNDTLRNWQSAADLRERRFQTAIKNGHAAIDATNSRCSWYLHHLDTLSALRNARSCSFIKQFNQTVEKFVETNASDFDELDKKRLMDNLEEYAAHYLQKYQQKQQKIYVKLSW